MDLQNTGNAASVEIVNCIREAGLAPDETDLTQLVKALREIIQQSGVESIIPDLRDDGTEVKWPMRHNGKQVYARIIQASGFAQGSYMTIPHNIPDVEWIKISYDYSTVGLTGSLFFIENSNSTVWAFYAAGTTSIHYYSVKNYPTHALKICLLYTKTTDTVIG